MATNNLDNLLHRLSDVNDDTVPEWAKLLFDCFKVIITELKENKSFDSDIKDLKAEVNVLKNEINTLKKANDNNEQRGRNECLVLHGYNEEVNENTNNIVCHVIGNELGIPITEADIKNSHRLGPPRTQRSTRTNKVTPRPIIFRLSYFRTRINIYKNKRKLKGKPLLITENLTALRFQTFKAAIEKFGKNNVWTNEGRILTKFENKIHSFSSMEELQELQEM